MLERIVPKERANFDKQFNEMIESKRDSLRTAQERDLAKVEERIKCLTWNEVRRKDKELSVSKRRIDNHFKDMSHAHLLEGKLRAEMSVKPSALWQKRIVSINLIFSAFYSK